MSFKNYIKEKLKYLFGIAGVAALLSQLILPALGAQADGPRFNFLPGDLEMVRGVNVSENEAVWKNPVDGDAGQIFRGLVYYHNGVIDTAAKNTRVKVNIPAATTNSQAVIGTSISADNAATVTSTVVDGQIVGLNGLHLNLDKDADLEFIPGSVRWFPNSNVNGGPNQTPVPLPMGQTGDEIVSAGGVNIGDIQGCWEFAGFISFDFKSKVKEVRKELDIEKKVKNISRHESEFKKETSAKEGDEVKFEVEPINPGDVALKNVVVKDVLPDGLEFVSGTFEFEENDVVTPLSDNEAALFFGGGLDFGTLDPNSDVEFRFVAKVKTDCKDDVLVNKAIVTAEGLTAQAVAKVIVEKKADIKKSKSAFNDTKKKPADVVSTGDLVTFTLTAKNIGSGAAKFVFEDDVSEVLKFAEIVSISNDGKLVDGCIRWPEVVINPGAAVSRTFQVKIKHNVSDDCFNNFFGNNVKICVEKKMPNLHIDKFVRDVTTGESNFQKSNSAFAGDTLEYMITFSNTGNGPAKQVTFTDVLPPNTQYISGTTKISWNGCPEQALSDGIVDGGVTIPVIEVAETGFVKFQAKIASGVAAGEVLTNTGSLTHDKKTISATAETKIITQIVKAVQLPKSGATAGLVFLTTMIGGLGVLFVRYRKLMASSEVMIIDQLMSA